MVEKETFNLCTKDLQSLLEGKEKFPVLSNFSEAVFNAIPQTSKGVLCSSGPS
jgi:hypothetical protein